MAGVLRIHEAAAFTAIYVFVIEVFVYRDVSFDKDLPRVVRESMTLVGAILAILATAIGFTGYLIQDQLPMKILEAMQSLISSKLMFLLVLNVFLLIVGMLMDIFSAIVVVVPLILPIAREFGVDDFHLGIVFLLNLEIGYMTPPVGLNLFISSFRFDKPVTLLYRAVLPFIGILIVALVITTYVPKLSTVLVEALSDGEESLQLPDEPLPELEPPTPDGDATPVGDELDLDALENELEGGFDLDALENELEAEEAEPVNDDELDLDALEAELDSAEP